MMEPAESNNNVPMSQQGPHDLVLIVEDDQNMCNLLQEIVTPLAAKVIGVTSSQDALNILEQREVAVVLTDLRMPNVDGAGVLEFARQRNSMTQVIVITGYGTVDSAVEALKGGAADYIEKPFENTKVHRVTERALQYYALARENARLRSSCLVWEDAGLIGESPVMDPVIRLVHAAASYDCGVLITGETGTGKELVARQVHQLSPRREAEFVGINCAAIPDTVIESELFGYVRGAFTGADRPKTGMFTKADGGTLLLDEVNNASLSLQAKLLRALQDGTFYRLGDTEPLASDVRILAASNRSLRTMIDQGEFREDLYYRLKVVEIEIPPLRDRREDIPLLSRYFMEKHSKRLGKAVDDISTRALGALMGYDWPGNVRELENVIQRMIVLARDETLDEDLVPGELTGGSINGARALDYIPPQSLDDLEAYFIRKTLSENKGQRGITAQVLGIDKSTLWRKMKRYGIATE